jgi:hypothetical protein
MQLNASEISELIKSRIQGLGDTAEIRIKARLFPCPTVSAVSMVCLT